MIKITYDESEMAGRIDIYTYVNPGTSELAELEKTIDGFQCIPVAPNAHGNKYEEIDVCINNNAVKDILNWLVTRIKESSSKINTDVLYNAATGSNPDTYYEKCDYYEMSAVTAYSAILTDVLARLYEHSR